ncbi:toll/interleukin-1 receptor domain-containing protein [Leptothrix ochracea]|uniref:toll/interleukin-1 receptor domain-containing protein n=1 Tax=Leptothrix ochracea TaxID=735331 RepID=UPI0034E2D2FB
MPVFLSHKREDSEATLRIASYLRNAGITCYVDVLDPSIKSTDDLTSLLRDRIHKCTHLMAVVSSYTTQSWWVPFEIGIGTEIDRRITSYQLSSVALPDFLTKWPILHNESDLGYFVALYRQDASVPLSEGRTFQANVSSASSFHTVLKTLLKQ